MTPDAKWLEILKASGWQTTALAAAFGAMVLVMHMGWIGSTGAWFSAFFAFCTLAFLICFFLALASILHAVADFVKPKMWLAHWAHQKQQRKAVREYIPYMMDREKLIIAYLLHHNQKTFTGAMDGGYAATLISRGIIVQALVSGQAWHPEEVPYVIPDHVWDALAENKNNFPYKSEQFGDVEPHPWRVHWMDR